MLLILGFAETSIASEPITLQDREVPLGKKRGAWLRGGEAGERRRRSREVACRP
jgi:hypothetical protein